MSNYASANIVRPLGKHLSAVNGMAPFQMKISDFLLFGVLVAVLVLVAIGMYKQDEHKVNQDCEDAAALEAGQVFGPFFNWKNWLWALCALVGFYVLCLIVYKVRGPAKKNAPGNDEGLGNLTRSLEDFADLSTLSSLSTLSRQMGDVTELNSIGDVLRM